LASAVRQITFADGHDGIVLAQAETDDGAIPALLEIVVTPHAPEMRHGETQ